MKKFNLFQNLILNCFSKEYLIVEINFLLIYMNFPKEIQFQILSLNIQKNYMEIVLGVPSNNFVYTTIYKDIIIGKMSRYFLSKYKVSLVFLVL